MTKLKSPIPTNIEVILDPSKVMMSKTNHKGIIQYMNDYFVEVSGYQEYELAGKPHNIIRHPDMPKVIFKIIWEKLRKGDNFYTAIKNLTKNGGFYWEFTYFETTYDEYGNPVYYAKRKPISEKIKNEFTTIYKQLLTIEKHNLNEAYEFFYNLIEDSGLSYNEFILALCDMSSEEAANLFK